MSENIPYIIAENGYYYVAYKEKAPVPEIVVSSKGVANGLSEEYNDGWDFGPDSYNPSITSGVPLTQTTGIGEALQYGNTNDKKVFIKNGTYNWNDELQNYVPNNGIIMIEGEAKEGVQINLLNNHWFTDNENPAYLNTVNIEYLLVSIKNVTFNNLGNSTYPYSRFIFIYTQYQYFDNIDFNATPNITSSNSPFYLVDMGYNLSGYSYQVIKNIRVLANGSTALISQFHLENNYGKSNTYIDTLYCDYNIWLANGNVEATNLNGSVQLGANGDMSGLNDIENFNISNINGTFSISPGSNGTSYSHKFNMSNILTTNGSLISQSSTDPVHVRIDNAMLDSVRLNIGSPTLFDVRIHNYYGIYTTVYNYSHFDWNLTASPTSPIPIYIDIDGTFQVKILNSDVGSNSATYTGILKFRGHHIANPTADLIIGTIDNIDTVLDAYIVGLSNGYSAPTTPTVPASGTAQQNTNPYAVDVYIYGGDVTEIQITRNGTAYTVLSVSTAIAMSGQSYRLNPGDSITLTYSTAPSWEWLAE